MKPVIALYDVNNVGHANARGISEWAAGKGYEMLMCGIYASAYPNPEAIKIIDLSNLPPAEIEELRRLCAEKVTA